MSPTINRDDFIALVSRVNTALGGLRFDDLSLDQLMQFSHVTGVLTSLTEAQKSSVADYPAGLSHAAALDKITLKDNRKLFAELDKDKTFDTRRLTLQQDLTWKIVRPGAKPQIASIDMYDGDETSGAKKTWLVGPELGGTIAYHTRGDPTFAVMASSAFNVLSRGLLQYKRNYDDGKPNEPVQLSMG